MTGRAQYSRTLHIITARKHREWMPMLSGFLPPLLVHPGSELMEGATHIPGRSSPTQLILSGNALINPTIVCFTNLISTSQSNQVDNQN
jgi:hypothetical protein